MTRDDIIRMAREAGFIFWEEGERKGKIDWACEYDEDLERFAALVAAAEREACAKVCESLSLEWEDQKDIAQAEWATMMDCAAAIRARGEAK